MATRKNGNGRGSLTRSDSGVWIAWYTDESGTRRKRSTKVKTKGDAQRILERWIVEVQRIREGLVDPEALQRKRELERPLREHVREYFENFQTTPRSEGSIRVKRHGLRKLFKHTRRLLEREPTLADLKPDLVRRAMKREHDSGLSARSCNGIRKEAVAFGNWLTQEGRADLGGFGKRVPKFDEALDRRRERRVLTDAELGRLFAVAAANGRTLWYEMAYYAGMRRGELCRVSWGDIDLQAGVLRIRNQKVGRVDEVAIHPALVASLATARESRASAGVVLGSERVFPAPVSGEVRLRDFNAAGIPTTDADGRYADLHALRTTLCTCLLRAGTPPTVVQKIMRHSSIATTLKHYAKLGLLDAAAALSAVPVVAPAALAVAPTGARKRRSGGSNGGSNSGSNSGSSRGSNACEKPREAAMHGANALAPSVASAAAPLSPQPQSPQEPAGSHAKAHLTARRKSLPSFPSRLVSSVGRAADS
jgi:integrase